MLKFKIIAILLSILAAVSLVADELLLSARVLTAEGKTLAGANVLFPEEEKGAATDYDGYFSIKLNSGPQAVIISYIGFKTFIDTLNISPDMELPLHFFLQREAFEIGGITVLADRDLLPDQAASVSEIRSGEIEHLQASSLGDVLQLLPGRAFQNPGLTAVRQAAIRSSSVEGTADRNEYLGTQVIIDDNRISNNANLQIDTDANSGTVQRTTENSGVDLRQIPADNIESVEIIRGVPSSKYGDLTSGVVKVQTKISPDPLRMKYKTNLQDQELNLNGGIKISSHTVSLNLNAANSARDPRIKDYDYTRLSGQLNHRVSLGKNRLTLTQRFYITRTFDEQGLREGDLMQTERYNRDAIFRWNSQTQWLIQPEHKLNINISLNRNRQNSYAKRLVSVDNTYITDRMTSGVQEGAYVQHYISQLWVKGLAETDQLHADYQGKLQTGNISHQISSGLTLQREGNNGEGRIFDPLLPPSINSAMRSRPRAYSETPDLWLTALYAENRIKGVWGIPWDLQLGLRYDQFGENEPFSRHWGDALQPRANFMLSPTPKSRLRFGYGMTAKSPTLAMLYPNPIYYDLDDINEYNDIDSLRRVIVSTEIYQRHNPHLKASRQKKMELGGDLELGNFGFSLSLYRNQTKDGFIQSDIIPIFRYKYDYPVWPDTSGKSIRDSVWTYYSRYENSASILSEGIEFSLQTRPVLPLSSRLRIEASWNRTETAHAAY
ncbi:MAG TPA: TonB-dependent receptor, partial [Candidatus Marinimicrobia bacterium]|nr:TonB-dependent receptor [Candidatus Neomarinimicrobiota bacterium]